MEALDELALRVELRVAAAQIDAPGAGGEVPVAQGRTPPAPRPSAPKPQAVGIVKQKARSRATAMRGRGAAGGSALSAGRSEKSGL